MVSIALEFGFVTPPLPEALLVSVQVVAIVAYVCLRVYQIVRAGFRWEAIRSCMPDFVLLAIAGLVIVFVQVEASHQPIIKASALYVGVMQALLLTRLLIAGVRLNLALSQSHLHPARVMALAFCALILLGGLALSLPKATNPGLLESSGMCVYEHILNCMFTAISACCVTGLAIYDTGQDFTLFGQIVILILIQAGGLGIMIFGGVFGLLAGRQLSLKQSLVLQDSLSHRTIGQLRSMVAFVVILTIVAEAVGAAALYPLWSHLDSVWLRIFYSVFHAVSAFCNAGFALQSDSLIPYRGAWQVYGAIVPLIVVGGLGFPVLSDLWQLAKLRLQRFLASISRNPAHRGPAKRRVLSLHTRLVLLASGVLIFVPTLLFFILESDPLLSSGPGTVPPESQKMVDGGVMDRLLDSFFLSITCRTAGFNTVEMNVDSMTSSSHFLASLLMFIGGSPASTAGGVKTIGIAVLILGVTATLQGRKRIEAFGRTIPEDVVRRAAAVVFVMFGLASLSTLLLCSLEDCSLREALFESVSACGTVGLSTGLTPHLTLGGRIVIMVVMFAGRLGPLTLLVALAGRRKAAQYEYAMESVVIG